jgi:hypothetical protein
MRDLDAVAAIVDALREVHGDGVARLMLQDGMTLAALIDTLLRARLRNREAARLVTAALQSGDFAVTPDFTTAPSHVKYVYDPPRSLQVVDVVMLTERRAFASNEIRLRLL